jgi:hypothetical protein
LILTLEKYFILFSQAILKKIISNVFSNEFRSFLSLNYFRGIIFLLLGLFLTNCDKFNQQTPDPSPKDKTIQPIPYMTIVRSSGVSLVKHADSTQEKGGIGTFLLEGDKVLTEKNAWIDIQYNSETLLRLFPQTRLEIKSLKILEKKSLISLELLDGIVYSKVFYANDSNKFIIKTPFIISNTTGAEFIVSNNPKGSRIKVKFGKVVSYPRIFSLEDRDPLDVKPEEKNGKIATAVSEKMLLLENLTFADLHLNYNFLKPLESIENLDDYSKQISELDFPSRKASFSDSEIVEFNGMSLTDTKLIEDFYSISRELQAGNKDPKKMEELEGNRSSLENLLSKNNYSDYKNNTSSLEEPDGKTSPIMQYSRSNHKKWVSGHNESVVKYPPKTQFLKGSYHKKWISRSVSKKLSYYKRKGKYKRLAHKKKFKTEKEVYEYYERLDKLTLTENRVEVGTIITQDSSLIILHTSEGIKRIPSEEVIEINFDYLKPN